MPRLGGDTFQELRQAALAQAVCRCMARSFHLLPSAYAANVLADLFRTVHFNATALSWYKEAEQAAGDAETIRSARRGRKALRKAHMSLRPTALRRYLVSDADNTRSPAALPVRRGLAPRFLAAQTTAIRCGSCRRLRGCPRRCCLWRYAGAAALAGRPGP